MRRRRKRMSRTAERRVLPHPRAAGTAGVHGFAAAAHRAALHAAGRCTVLRRPDELLSQALKLQAGDAAETMRTSTADVLAPAAPDPAALPRASHPDVVHRDEDRSRGRCRTSATAWSRCSTGSSMRCARGSRRFVQRDTAARRIWELIDLLAANIRGIVAAGLEGADDSPAWTSGTTSTGCG